MSPTHTADDEPLDPIVEATIERAMRPYLGVLPPAALQTMRDLLVETLTTHPVALDAVEALRERPAAGGSGTRLRDGAEAAEDGGEKGVA